MFWEISLRVLEALDCDSDDTISADDGTEVMLDVDES
jgi:hypothetical protein